MQIINLQAHYDGEQILLDEPYDLEPNTKLVVSVVEMESASKEGWSLFALENLESAYADDEPDYPLELVKEPNPKYEGR